MSICHYSISIIISYKLWHNGVNPITQNTRQHRLTQKRLQGWSADTIDEVLLTEEYVFHVLLKYFLNVVNVVPNGKQGGANSTGARTCQSLRFYTNLFHNLQYN